MSKEIANLFVTNRSQIDLKFSPEYRFKKKKSILNRTNLTRVCETITFSTCAHIKKVKKLPIFFVINRSKIVHEFSHEDGFRTRKNVLNR